MSNNAAIRRRAGTATPNPVSQVQRNFQNNLASQNNVPSNDPRGSPNAGQNSSTQGLTLQQVISLIDARLVTLESITKDHSQIVNSISESNASGSASSEDDHSNNIESLLDEKLEEYFSEFNTRTELLATEISDIKEIVLKLQAYTMDVNKMLMDERTRFFSDTPRMEGQASSTKEEPLFSISNRVPAADQNITVENTVKTETVHLEDLASTNNVNEVLYDEEGLLADTTISEDLSAAGAKPSEEEEDSEVLDNQLVNKKRQRAANNTNNKKTFKLSV
jgi:hypothetical protein